MHWLHSLLLTLIKYPTRLLVKTKPIPMDIHQELGLDREKPVIYLLHTHSATDLIALQQAAGQLGLPDPMRDIHLAGHTYPANLSLEQPQGLFSRKVRSTAVADNFIEILRIQRENPEMDLQMLPVSVFWGRAPEKSKPGWSDLLADRASPSWLRKLFIVLFLGRDNFVYFSRAVSSQRMVQERGSDEIIAHKLIRVARTHFYRRQQAMTGPQAIDRQQLQNAILGAKAVKLAITEEQKDRKLSQEQARRRAQEYLEEIAADYREGVIRFADRLLTRVWNKIYNGIEVKNAARIRELAQNGHEIIYVPCHRSHMDYLLLTYVIYHEGLATPHIAAGINLNFWPVGGIFRRGGAFFLRRSFAGNKLYTAVFKEYLELLFNRGYPVKYYPEGGRSRTGRLLPPKTGMLAMTLQAMLKGVRRPVSLVPVYLGYENVMELGSYMSELKGSSKKKESFWQLFSALKKLKNYGHGYLNFGEPIHLNHYLDRQVPEWRKDIQQEAERKPSWLTPTVNHLANQVMCRINQSAAVNGMALASLCLLAAQNHALEEKELASSLSHLLDLLKREPFSPGISAPEQDSESLLKHVLSLGKLRINEDTFGRIVSLDEYSAITQTYYRNNILHLFALPGLIATIVQAGQGIEKAKLLDGIGAIYPLLKRELFIYMDSEEALAHTERLLHAMKDLGLLQQQGRKIVPAQRTDPAYLTLTLLAQTVQQTLQRYAIVLTVLEKEQSIARASLEKQSRALAEHLSAINGVQAPEFYDKNVFASFINALKDNDLVGASEEGGLMHTVQSAALKELIVSLVNADVAQKLYQLHHSEAQIDDKAEGQ
ncbi:glycerol-3-phosphate 1-O-acyltransferase PlsB [Bowmanella dokdonensis]|uniref:Glycerol-3-phosphate acyltransferase n=1 Tax=Bowmanella dokdonensis TaxID=751969 RepID=A0A939IPJ4_9ALTE|nr:glycerol-3-phosphate 1-O-acyltransferase PlsB [Bowmanella dokdonensis]MBN7823607.1 glycerol-3-phosphate 1-O-acyltransferase PlsB [Bowmanella dokdonensis]